MKRLNLILICFVIFLLLTKNSNSQDFNELMMKCTYYIEGLNDVGDKICGSCFIIGKYTKNDSNRVYPILITAKHIFRDITKDKVSILIRRKIYDSLYFPFEYIFDIRNNGKNLYSTHPDTSIDIVAMFLPIPNTMDIDILPTSYLADDKFLKEFEIHPGDNVFCLGFPYGYNSNDLGFPILSEGVIASYPILPTKLYKNMLININVFSGNSGGPIYMYEKLFVKDNVLFPRRFAKILGLLSKQYYHENEYEGEIFFIKEKIYLKIAEITPSSYIKELIEITPCPDTEK